MLIFNDSHRGQKIILDQTKPDLVLASVKSEFQAEFFLMPNWLGGFYRDSLVIDVVVVVVF